LLRLLHSGWFHNPEIEVRNNCEMAVDL
jgi:hypothetical protein